MGSQVQRRLHCLSPQQLAPQGGMGFEIGSMIWYVQSSLLRVRENFAFFVTVGDLGSTCV